MLQVALLGEQAITDDGAGAVRARSSRAIVLVAYLVCHAGSPQTRQRIAGLLWPESTDAQALTNLRRELHHLRQVLADDPSLIVTSRDLCWRDSRTCRVDARVFDAERAAALAAAAAGDDGAAARHATAAIAEYGGDLLPGVYDDWLLDARSELERQCVELCDLASAALSRTGDLPGAVRAARRRVQLQPLEEAGYRTLMRLQADVGDRAGAVSTYHHCASVLERELGIVPDAATRTAFQRLMTHARPAHRPGAVTESLRRPGLGAVPLVGRTAELGLLHDAWQAAAAGRRGLVLVRGGAGVGKTRLVAEVADLARRRGAVVARSQCFGTPGRLALAPVADWVRNPAIQSAAARLDPAWRAEVARLLPAGGYGGPGTGSRAMADAWQRHRFFEGLARALIAVGRPLLLVLDNMQWCDHETLAFTTLFLGLARDARLLVAGTIRDDDLGQEPELAGWTARMRASGLLTELSLSPLEPSGTAQLAREVSGQPLGEADASLLYAATGGFPLYVIEAVRGTVDLHRTPLPAGDVAAVLRKRLEQTTAPAREVASLAAAVGTNFTLGLLTEASDLDPDTVVEAVDELWRRRIVQEFRDGYDFSHDMLREAAYELLSPPRRWLVHRRIAQALELEHAGDTDGVAAQLAEQYARAGRREQALAHYRRAADVAAGMFAHDEAIRLHRNALSIVRSAPGGPGRDGRELAVLEAMAAPLNASRGYASQDLQEVLERLIAVARSLDRTDSTVYGLVALSASRFVQGHIADGYQLASQALELAGAGSELGGQAHFIFGGSAVSLGMPADGLHHLQLAAKLAGGAVSLILGTRSDVHPTAWSAHAHWLLGDEEGAISACREAVSLARAIGHPYSLGVALGYACMTHQMCGDAPGVGRIVGELGSLCNRYGFAYYREWALILDGWSRMTPAGIEMARRGIANLRSEGSLTRMPYWLSLLADLSARCGRPGAARKALDAALSSGQAREDVWWLPEVMRMRASYDGEQAAISRLRSAAGMAAAHGSAGLLRRCQRDLRGHGVRPSVRGALSGV